MRVKCLSVRLSSFEQISAKAYKATAYDGSSAIIPASQVYGQDYEVSKTDAWWISEWILEKKELQYSHKKIAWFDKDTGRQLPTYIVENHIPSNKFPVYHNEINALISE